MLSPLSVRPGCANLAEALAHIDRAQVGIHSATPSPHIRLRSRRPSGGTVDLADDVVGEHDWLAGSGWPSSARLPADSIGPQTGDRGGCGPCARVFLGGVTRSLIGRSRCSVQVLLFVAQSCPTSWSEWCCMQGCAADESGRSVGEVNGLQHGQVGGGDDGHTAGWDRRRGCRSGMLPEAEARWEITAFPVRSPPALRLRGGRDLPGAGLHGVEHYSAPAHVGDQLRVGADVAERHT